MPLKSGWVGLQEPPTGGTNVETEAPCERFLGGERCEGPAMALTRACEEQAVCGAERTGAWRAASCAPQI